MSEKTAKYFNLVHEAILGANTFESGLYRLGYMSGTRNAVSLYLPKTINALRAYYLLHLGLHTPFAAGLARAIQEVIWDKQRRGGEAA